MSLIRKFLIAIFALLQIGLSLCPFVPFVRDNIWSAQTTVNSFASSLATYIGLEFLILSTLVYLLLEDFKAQSRTEINNFGALLQRYTPLTVRQLRENEFYKDFLGQCVRAEHFVNISYYAPRPPEIGGSVERVKYYREIAGVMRNNINTRFRRIVRDTPANRQWVLSLIEDLVDTTNCSIALIDDFDETVEMGRALSVQIVDGKIAWLVAIAEHGGAEIYRDIAIENAEVTNMLNKYFDRLWQLSRIIFEPGYDLARSRRAIRGEG